MIFIGNNKFRTLEQPIYLKDGRQVKEVWANGTMVYPEELTGNLVKVYGRLNTTIRRERSYNLPFSVINLGDWMGLDTFNGITNYGFESSHTEEYHIDVSFAAVLQPSYHSLDWKYINEYGNIQFHAERLKGELGCKQLDDQKVFIGTKRSLQNRGYSLGHPRPWFHVNHGLGIMQNKPESLDSENIYTRGLSVYGKLEKWNRKGSYTWAGKTYSTRLDQQWFYMAPKELIFNIHNLSPIRCNFPYGTGAGLSIYLSHPWPEGESNAFIRNPIDLFHLNNKPHKLNADRWSFGIEAYTDVRDIPAHTRSYEALSEKQSVSYNDVTINRTYNAETKQYDEEVIVGEARSYDATLSVGFNVDGTKVYDQYENGSRWMRHVDDLPPYHAYEGGTIAPILKSMYINLEYPVQCLSTTINLWGGGVSKYVSVDPLSVPLANIPITKVLYCGSRARAPERAKHVYEEDVAV